MTVALGLLAAAVLVGLFGPVYLRGTISPRLRPGVALTGWIASVTVVIGCAAGAAILLSLPHNEVADTVLGMATVCINTGHRPWETALRLSGSGLLLGAAVRIAVVAVRLGRHGATRRHRHLTALELLGRAEPHEGTSLFWLPDTAPVAYSLGGQRKTIVATTGVANLRPSTRAAILAHEHAHLRGRHHGLVLLVEVLARALPFVPLFQCAAPAVRVLVELSADAAAARSCGVDRVRDALRATTADGVPTASLAMSGESVELRMRWLAPAPRGARHRVRDRVGHVTAALASLAPVFGGVGVVAGLVLLWCLGAPPA